jgi:Protein of unknown function, DUF481
MRNSGINFSIAIGLAIVSALVPSAARAQVPAAAPPAAQAPAAAPAGFSGTVTAGISLETGRTDLSGVQIAFHGRRPYSTHGALTMGSTYTHATTQPPGSPRHITVADRQDGNVGIEHNYGKRWVLMVRGQALRDPIARIDYRIEQITGFGVRMGTGRVQARVIPGVAFLTHDKNVAGENGFNMNYGIYQDARIVLAPTWTLTEVLSASRDPRDRDDYFYMLDTRLTGAITRRLGIQLSYQHSFESLLPVGVELRYQKTVAGLQFSF